MIFLFREVEFFCPERLRDFIVPRCCVIFFVERLLNFLCPKRLRDFFFVPREWVIFLS